MNDESPKTPAQRRAEQQRAAREHLESLEPTAGDGDNTPPGMKLVPLHEAGIFVPRTTKRNQALRLSPFQGENVVDFTARRRLYNSTRIAVPADTAAGHALFEEHTGAPLTAYQREVMECEWIKRPEMKPEHERFTLTWRKVRDDLGDWWVTPSGRIMLNALYFTPPKPEPPKPRQGIERIAERETFYRPLKRR